MHTTHYSSTTPSKYIFISGGVISGIGKGITSASIGLILKSAGYTVAPLKFENYLNVDAGTINPIEHGDTFLCDDGTETDMDIGTYEKYLDQNMGIHNFCTIGNIYKTVIDRERRFEYNGEDVEAVPHITDEIISRIETVATKSHADIVLIELGGTVGEYQNSLYYEAARILKMRKPNDVIHVHVSYVPTPGHLGEPKTKPTQLSVKTLLSMGIQPDFIVARCSKPLDDRRKERLALFCNVPAKRVISNPDVSHVYEIPIVLEKQSMSLLLTQSLGLVERPCNLERWQKILHTITETKHEKPVEVVIVGKYFTTGEYNLKDSYAALFDAIDHASWHTRINIRTRWVSAEEVEKKGVHVIGTPAGIIVPIGWGIRGAEGMIATAGYARDKKIPYLGLCYGMQLAIVSFARDKAGITHADTTENNPHTTDPVIHIIPTQKELVERRAYGGTMRLGAWEARLKKDTKTRLIYENQETIWERHRHRYEFNDTYATAIENAGMVISGRSVVENLCEFIEIPDHPFYIATQGHPEYKSRPTKPHPLFVAFTKACKQMYT